MKLSTASIGRFLEAVSEDYSFSLKIEEYAPHICAAVHDGHQFRKSLWKYCLLSEYERWYEEDPATRDMVANQPIVLAGRDSRFEYDLNREAGEAIYTDAWGKALWKQPLPEDERSKSLQKHASFYKVVDALVRKIEEKYGRALVFDMHSYNYRRWERAVPTWNLGTRNIDQDRFGKMAESWSRKLGKIRLPGDIPSTSKINDTFEGNGYFLKYISSNFDNTLVLATEISKVYADELGGIIFPEVVEAVRKQLGELIPLQVQEFQE